MPEGSQFGNPSAASDSRDSDKMRDEAHDLLAILPPTPRRRELENLLVEAFNPEGLQAALAEIKKTADKRRRMVEQPFGNLPEDEQFFGHDPETERKKETREQIWLMVREFKEDKTQLVGSGKTAMVARMPGNLKSCFKIIVHPREYRLNNNVQQEADFLAALENFEVAGVRTPRAHYYIMDKRFHVIAMENLDAVSLDDVFSGLRDLPPTFDFNDFFSSLEEYIQAMHRQKKIYHRDLHLGNVMVDIKTGKPRVVDFGLSVKSASGRDGIYEEARVLAGRESQVSFPPDEDSIKILRRLLTDFLAKRDAANYF